MAPVSGRQTLYAMASTDGKEDGIFRLYTWNHRRGGAAFPDKQTRPLKNEGASGAKTALHHDLAEIDAAVWLANKTICTTGTAPSC